MRYRLPEVLGGGECVIVEVNPALTLMGKPAHVVRTPPPQTLDDGFDYVVVQRDALIEMEDPLPPEPPVGAVVLDRDGHAWQRGLPGRGNWCCTEGAHAEDEWMVLVLDYGPLTRLVPDPAVGVELPWRWYDGREDGSQIFVERNGTVRDRVMVGDHRDESVFLSPAVARAKAAALLAAADAAEAVRDEP